MYNEFAAIVESQLKVVRDWIYPFVRNTFAFLIWVIPRKEMKLGK
jgi:hypothetical protein